MKLIGRKLLTDFKSKHMIIQSPLNSWEAEASAAEWKTPHDIKKRYPKASILGNKQVIFDIKGDQFRIHTLVDYQYQIIFIKKIGTHDEYIKWSL